MTGAAEPKAVSDSSAPRAHWCLVTVAGVSLELPGVHPEVLLRESEAPFRQLRIPVGFAEGTAIAYAWRTVPTARPLTPHAQVNYQRTTPRRVDAAVCAIKICIATREGAPEPLVER